MGRSTRVKYLTRPLNFDELTTDMSPPGPGWSAVEFRLDWFGVGRPNERCPNGVDWTKPFPWLWLPRMGEKNDEALGDAPRFAIGERGTPVAPPLLAAAAAPPLVGAPPYRLYAPVAQDDVTWSMAPSQAS